MDTQDSLPDVSVIVPTLDEAVNIDRLVRQLLHAFGDRKLGVEILFADGGSADGTLEKVRAWASVAPVRLIDAASGRGLAGDVLVVAREARADTVVVMDADLSHDPEMAPVLARAVLTGGYDMAIGSRYIPGGQTPDWPWTRRLVSRAGAMVVWPLTDIRDPTSGFFAICKDRLLSVDGKAEGFKIALEVLLRNGDDLRVTELPISFRDRCFGQSKMSTGQVISFLRRSAALAGGVVTATTARRFTLVGCLSLAADLSVFQTLWSLGLNLAASHMLSFLAGAILCYVLSLRWVFRSVVDDLRDRGTPVRFLAMCLLILFLRGGVLALWTQHAAWRVQAALAVAASAGMVLTYCGCAFFVFRRDTSVPHLLSWRVLVVGLVGYTVLLRLVYLGSPDLLPEEAYYWNYAQHPDYGYLDHPPMVAWLISFGTAVFGDTEFGVRIGTFLCWFLTAAFCFGLARNLFGKASGLVSVLLVAVLPFFFLFGFFSTPDVPLTACWAGTLFFLERALLARRPRAWWGVGVCVGLGVLSKYTIVLLGPATLFFILVDPSSRRWFVRYQPYAALLVSLLLSAPVILWNIENDWASFAFQSTCRLSGSREFGMPALVLSIVGLITPLGFIGGIQAILSKRDWQIEADPLLSAAAKRRLFTGVFTLVPLSVFVLFSLRHEPKPNWTGPLWLAVLPALARQVTLAPGAVRNRLERFGQRAWTPGLMATLLFLGGLLHYLCIGLPGVGIDGNMSLPVAWEEFGRDVERMEETVETTLHCEPLVVGMDRYFIASELAFYRRDGREGVEHTSSRHLFGDSAVMYSYWFPPERQSGRVLLLVSFDRRKIDDPVIRPWVDQAGPIEERAVSKQGRRVRYFCRVAQGYHPSPAVAAAQVTGSRTVDYAQKEHLPSVLRPSSSSWHVRSPT